MTRPSCCCRDRRRPGPLRPGARGVLGRERRAAPAAAGRGGRPDVLRAAAGRGRRQQRPRVRRPGGAGDGQRHRGAAAPRRGLSCPRRRRRGWPALFATLRPRPPRRRTSRHQRWHRGTIDAPRTLRASLRHLGEPAEVAWRRRGNKPRRVVLLVDVSGSMSGYADALLRLAHRFTQGAAVQGGVVETFTVGTRLTHVTRALRGKDAERALIAAGETVPVLWSGGTRLGETLKIFIDRWGQRGLARGAVVVVLSDGWERGDPAQLAEQMTRLKRVAHRVVSVNPAVGEARLRAGAAGRARRTAPRRRTHGRPLPGHLRRAGGGGCPCVMSWLS